ncbi:MAG: hypothetical protein ABIG43_06400 [Chloroflexota bacterium]
MACGISQAQSNPVVQTSSVPPTLYLQVTSDASSGREGTQYWKGTLPDSFYLLDSHGVPAIEISGISWMILTYDKISGDITSFDFGMSEVTYKILSDEYSSGFEYRANADASTFPRELGLTGPVWTEIGSDTLNGLNVGVQQFSFVLSNNVDCERWTFNYTSDQMTGGVENLNPTNLDSNCNFWNRQSKTNAFHLYRQ